MVLLDLNLPRKDGREVLTEIKADKDLSTLSVVVLTTSAAEQDMLRAQELQAHGYITKPVEVAKLLDVVRAIESFCILVVAVPLVPVLGGTAVAGQ